NQLESGFAARMVSGSGRLAGMAASERAYMRGIAEILAEGIENIVSVAPSALAGAAMNDDLWHGNVALNVLGAAAPGVGQAGALSAGMAVGGQAFGALGRGGRRALMSLRSPEARLAAGSTRMRAAFNAFRGANPQATYRDFLASPESSAAWA